MIVLLFKHLAPDHDTVRRALGHGVTQFDFHSKALERAMSILRKASRIARQHARAGLDEDDTSPLRVDAAEVG